MRDSRPDALTLRSILPSARFPRLCVAKGAADANLAWLQGITSRPGRARAPGVEEHA